MILVAGANSRLGRTLVEKLLQRGEQVRAMVRDRSRAQSLREHGAQIVLGDLRDPESLRFAVRGATAVVSSIHSMLGKGESASELVDDEGHRSLIDAAREAGVQHFVYVSVLGASADHPVDFWRTKARVEAALRNSGLDFTIVRPSAFMELYAWELVGRQVASRRRVVLAGKGRNPRNHVAVDDVAEAIAAVLGNPSMRGRILEIGGPENLSQREIVAIFQRVTGERARLITVPLSVLRLASRLFRRVHPGVARLLHATVVAETTDQTFDAAASREILPVDLTSMETFAHRQVAATVSELSRR